ncbi:hypothetical protein MY4824_006074 [Beauveria thailandica]
MESYTIAVIGSAGAGKSTFIQKVLGLSRPPIGSSASVRLVVDNVTHGVSLFELDLENFDQAASSQTIQWPKQINGHIVPRPDAALVLYDVTNPDSVRPLPQAMTAITNAGLPSILVACKCEIDEDDWEVDADGVAGHKIFKSCIGTYKVSSDKAEVSRSCLQAILKAAITYRKEHSETITRRRAQSAVNLEAPDTSSARPLSQQSKHSRASSEMSALRGFGSQSSESYRARASKNSGQVYRNEKPSADYFLDVEESDSEGQAYSDDIPILQRGEDNFVEKQPKMSGVPLAELVDRLLALRLSRADNNFSDIFLCLYRKFTTPTELFSAILSRLDRVRDDKTAHYLSKTATQLRIIEVIAKWVSLYPGDFAKFSTRKSLFEFIQHLSAEPIFSVASQQMRRSLRKSTLEDDDTGWAASDHSGSDSDDQESSKEMDELSASIGMVQVDEEGEGGSETNAPADFAGQPGGQVQFHSYDEYEREAASLEPADLHPMNKTRYHIFMDLSDDEIADELTRIDWILFSSIRIRDFVRYVNLSSTKKEKAASLKNVNRMINHFNHIAKWVANLILLRDKAKHRAQMLEKFMNVAIKLRQLNNYNGLAAVLAGINGIAIHRLAQTRQLVSPEVQKRFARAVILMSTQKSHSAYRLAWENSPLPRIPFVPLHLRDLVNAEEGSKTFVGPNGDRVNWRKFEVLGDVLLPLMKSQGTSYPNLAKHMLTRELILGCRMPTDDELDFRYKTNHYSKYCCFDRALHLLFAHKVLSMGTVQLPTVAVCSRQTGLQADLRTSLRFRNGPLGDMVVSSADDLIRLRKEENLWIIPASACRMRISVRTLGRVSGQNLDKEEVARWIESCDIWERLRLRVRHCDAPGDSALEFSLQHPDLSASLACPSSAAKMELQELRCQIEITQHMDERRSNKRRRGSANEMVDKARHQWRSESSPAGDVHSDASAMHKFVTGLTVTTEHVPRRYFEEILQAATTVLVTGSARHFTAINVKPGNTTYALVRIVPAVFNGLYVKHTAQSPRLKRKLRSLTDRGGIEEHLWYSTLSRMKPASVPGPKMIAARQGNQAIEDEVVDQGVGSNLICFGEDLFSSGLHGVMNDGAETLQREASPTVQIYYDAFEDGLPLTEGEFAESLPVDGGMAGLSSEAGDMIEFGSDFNDLETDVLFAN